MNGTADSPVKLILQVFLQPLLTIWTGMAGQLSTVLCRYSFRKGRSMIFMNPRAMKTEERPLLRATSGSASMARFITRSYQDTASGEKLFLLISIDTTYLLQEMSSYHMIYKQLVAESEWRTFLDRTAAELNLTQTLLQHGQRVSLSARSGN